MKRIGIFDSGIGGLAIARKLIKLPGLELLYYADTAHVPYGNRTQEEIQRLSYKAISFLIQQGVDAIIIACYTVSTNALDFLQQKFPATHFINVVDLVIDQLPGNDARKKIGILGTQATIQSKVLEKKIVEKNSQTHVIPIACPNLASAIEKNYQHYTHLHELVTFHCEPLQTASLDYLVLGCTHYELIQEIIKDVIREVNVITSEQTIIKKIEPLLCTSHRKSTIEYFSTADSVILEKNFEKILKA